MKYTPTIDDMMCFHSRTLNTSFSFILLLILFVCSPPDNQDQNSHTEIESIWNEFIESWHMKNAASFASIYLEVGWNVAPKFPVSQGREAISSLYDFLISENISNKYQLKILELTPSVEDLIESGNFQVDWVRNDESTWTFIARTQTHWIKDDQNNRKIKTLILNQAPEI